MRCASPASLPRCDPERSSIKSFFFYSFAANMKTAKSSHVVQKAIHRTVTSTAIPPCLRSFHAVAAARPTLALPSAGRCGRPSRNDTHVRNVQVIKQGASFSRVLRRGALAPQRRSASQNSCTGRSTLQRTALYDLHVANGGQMVPFGGYAMPVQYSDLGIGESHKWTREKASLFDVGHMYCRPSSPFRVV